MNPVFRLIGLVILFTFGMSACTSQNEQITLIELHYTDAEQALSVIAPLLPADIQVTKQVSSQSSYLLFTARSNDLAQVLKVLEQLDRPPENYLVEFRPSKSVNTSNRADSIKHYSTSGAGQNSSQSFRVTQGHEASISITETLLYPFFESPVSLTINETKVRVQYGDQLSSDLELTVLATHKGKQHKFHSQWRIPNHHWQSLSPESSSESIKRYSTGKKNPLSLEVKVTPISNGFSAQ